MKSLLFIATLLLALPLVAQAFETAACGWEGSDTILGNYSDIIATIETSAPVYNGSQSLKLVDDAASGTPQAFIGWVTNLNDDDTITASFWRYDDTPGAAPSCRIWGHWNDDPNDINEYSGSAGGLSDYGPGTGWDMVEYEWIVVDGHTGFVLEVRTYSNAGDTVWIDDLTITAPNGTTIIVPEDVVSLERQSWGGIKASF
ncbi:MAG: hypothetical protein KAR40_02710 [Candidatus Sabulitectum sp.]|nr:hypothetical protein [Candidatus Sabulitectum sp.]